MTSTSGSTVPLPIIGDRIAGKYRIERLLGRGGMGAVYLAEHEVLHQKVALKFLIPQLAGDPSFATRFLNEGRAVARIRSEHVASVFDADVDTSGATFLVMEYLDGICLEDELEARGRLPAEEAVRYVVEALEALAHAHALGIVHRDLKPSNLFLVRRPDGSRMVKLLDFGISKLRDEAQGSEGLQTAPNAVLGSPLFMAPEHVCDSASVDMRADIWSVGVILYRMLAGVLPFGGPTVAAAFAAILVETPRAVREHAPLVPEELQRVVMRCLEKERTARFKDTGELATALSSFAPGTRALTDRIVRVLELSGATAKAGGATLASPGAPPATTDEVAMAPRAAVSSSPSSDSSMAHAPTVARPDGSEAPVPLVSAVAAGAALIAALAAAGLGFWWLDQDVVTRPAEATLGARP